MHPNSPPLSTETISEMFAEYNLERQTRVETRKNKKKKIKNLFEKAYIEKNEESLANLLNLMKRDRSVRRYVTSRLSKAEKDVRIEYKVTNINKPWQGGAPGIGKRS